MPSSHCIIFLYNSIANPPISYYIHYTSSHLIIQADARWINYNEKISQLYAQSGDFGAVQQIYSSFEKGQQTLNPNL